jgi:hypothetical protein
MSFVSDVVKAGSFGLIDPMEGADAAAAAAQRAAGIQEAGVERGIGEIRGAEERALGFLSPFQQVGQQGIQQAGFLTDPQAQFEFLQNNPLFQQALSQAERGTKGMAAARGRLSAGDTLQQLSQNVLLSASPLIQQQKASIADLLNLGTGVAGRQAQTVTGTGASVADLMGTGAAARAAGEVGAANAQAQGIQDMTQLALTGASMLFPPAAPFAGIAGQAIAPGGFSPIPQQPNPFGF